MLASLEVRWFGRGSAPDDLGRWFAGEGDAPAAGPAEQRVDLYFLRGATEDLGIKVRAGKNVELKLRTADLGRLVLDDRADGRLEAWCKWTFPLEDEAGEEYAGDAWVRIEKTRLTRKFEVSDSAVREVPPVERIAAGCTVELTALLVQSAPWWTFGFEAFGPDGSHDVSLRGAAQAVFSAGSTGCRLPMGDSFGYPTWLRRIDRGGRPATSG